MKKDKISIDDVAQYRRFDYDIDAMMSFYQGWEQSKFQAHNAISKLKEKIESSPEL